MHTQDSSQRTATAGVVLRVMACRLGVALRRSTAALMLSVNPQLSVDQMITGLRRSARPHVQSPWLAACSMDNSSSCLCTTATCGAGILDAEQAMFYARDPASYVAPAGHAEVLDNAELAAADVTPQASPHPALEAEADTGGGAMGGPWLLLLALAVCALKPGVSWRPRRA